MFLPLFFFFFFFFNDTATTEIYTLSLHDALPISRLLNSLDFRCAEHNAPQFCQSKARADFIPDSLAAFDQSKRDQRDHDGIRRPDSLAGEPECKHAVLPRGILLPFSSHLEFRIPGGASAVEVDRILLRCPPEVPQKGLQVEPAIGRVRHPAQRPCEQFTSVIELFRLDANENVIAVAVGNDTDAI